MYDHNRDILAKGKKLRAKFKGIRYSEDRKMAQLGVLQSNEKISPKKQVVDQNQSLRNQLIL